MNAVPVDLRTAIDLEDCLQTIEVDVLRKKGQEFYALCPHEDHVDRKPSWSINFDRSSDNFGKHNCWSCPFGGNIVTLWAYKKGISTKDALADLRSTYVDLENIDMDQLTLAERERHESEEFELQFVEMDYEFELLDPRDQEEQWNYLLGRGVTSNQIKKYRIGYHTAVAKKFPKWIVFPVFFGGDTVGWRAKNPFRGMPEMASDNFPLGRVFFNWDNLDHSQDEVVIVEAILDLFRVLALDYIQSYRGHSNIVACMTNQIFKARVPLLEEFKRIIVIGDGDDGGRQLIDDVQNRFGLRSTCMKVELPEDTDPNDVPKKFLRSGLMKPKPIIQTRFLVDYTVRDV